MANRFDEVDDAYLLSGGNGRDLPDGDWTIVTLQKQNSSSGSAFHYFLSIGATPGSADALNWWIGEDDSGIPNEMRFEITDPSFDDTGQVAVNGLTYDENLGWYVAALGRDTTNSLFECRVVLVGATSISDSGSFSDAGCAALNEDTWHIGRRVDLNADRYFGGDMAYFYKADEYLSDAALIALANGAHPTRVSQNWVIGWDMNRGLNSNGVERIGGNTITKVSAPSTVEQPIVTRRNARIIAFNTTEEVILATGTLTLTGQNLASVQRNIDLAAGSLTLTGYGISVRRDIALAAGSLTLTGYDMGVSIPILLSTGSLTLTGLSVYKNTPLSFATLNIVGQGATIQRNIDLAAGSLTLSGQTITKNVPLATGTLTLTGYNISGINLAKATLTLSGFGVTVQRNIDLAAGSLTLTGQNLESVKRETNPATGSLTITGYPISVSRLLDLGVGAVTLTGYGVTVQRSISLAAGSLTLTGYDVGVQQNITLGVGTLTISGKTITSQVLQEITLAADSMTISGNALSLPVYVASVPVAGVGFFQYTPVNETEDPPGKGSGMFQGATVNPTEESPGQGAGLFQQSD